MEVKTICLTREEKEKLGKMKERTRSGTYRKTIELLISLYEQLVPSQRGEEIEFVEAVERGEVLSFIKKRLCVGISEAGENEVKAVVRRTDEKEGGKKKIKI
jgi:hypothetical protein